MGSLVSRPVVKGWWCIKHECNHYNAKRCAHKDIERILGKKMIRIINLPMCQVLTNAENFLNFKK